jgi:predicted HAD superfamily Cof-like phosphohydrolase
MSYYSAIQQFHSKVLGIEDTLPTLVLPVKFSQRVAFMEEEIEELGQAYMLEDLVGVADALADLVYVAIGTAHMMGIPFDAVFKVVHAANMQKLRGMTKRGMVYDAIKPEGWVGPEAEIKAILDAASKS